MKGLAGFTIKLWLEAKLWLFWKIWIVNLELGPKEKLGALESDVTRNFNFAEVWHGVGDVILG